MSNATIYDVAGKAQVSLATVSRVLNIVTTYKKSLRNIQLKLLASMMYVQHRFSLILCRQFANRTCAKQWYNKLLTE